MPSRPRVRLFACRFSKTFVNCVDQLFVFEYLVRPAHPGLPEVARLFGDESFSERTLRRAAELDHFLLPFFTAEGLARNNCWLSSQISFDRRLQGVIILQTLLHMRGLLFAQTDLMHAAAGITHGENGDRMPAAAVAVFAALAVADGAVEQGAAQDIAGFGKPGQKPVALADDLLLIH